MKLWITLLLIFSFLQVPLIALSDEGCTICKMKIASISVGMKMPEALEVLGTPQSKASYSNGECRGELQRHLAVAEDEDRSSLTERRHLL